MIATNLITLIICILNAFITNGQNAIIGNGQVILGVDTFGQLNVPYAQVLGLPGSDPLGIGFVGLRNGDGTHASTEPGCLCEGWGFSTGTVKGYANNHAGTAGLYLISPFSGVSGGTFAISHVRDSQTRSTFEVIHNYFPSPDSQYAMQCNVTIKNIGNVNWGNTFYRRVMDWDISPTEFSEYVSIMGWPATNLISSHDNGFCSADPAVICPPLHADTLNQNFVDNGPSDHGALFDFDLGPLNAGSEVKFKIYYGVAPGEVAAIQALTDVRAEVASLGQQAGDPVGGLPYTFFFGFGDVGGQIITICDKYKYIDDGTCRTWYEAQQYCQTQYGTDLATITTEEDRHCALDIITAANGTSPWIGLNSVYSGDAGNFQYSLDNTACTVPHNGIWGPCVISDWWRYTGNGAHEGRPRCPHDGEDGSQCVRLLPEPIGLFDNDIQCRDEHTITAVLCNAPSTS